MTVNDSGRYICRNDFPAESHEENVFDLEALEAGPSAGYKFYCVMI